MKHELIDDRSRIWVVMRGPDLSLQAEIDPNLLARLNPGHSAEEIADTLLRAAGEMENAESRAW